MTVFMSVCSHGGADVQLPGPVGPGGAHCDDGGDGAIADGSSPRDAGEEGAAAAAAGSAAGCAAPRHGTADAPQSAFPDSAQRHHHALREGSERLSTPQHRAAFATADARQMPPRAGAHGSPSRAASASSLSPCPSPPSLSGSLLLSGGGGDAPFTASQPGAAWRVNTIMEYCNGGSLQDYLQAAQDAELRGVPAGVPQMSACERMLLGWQVAAGMAYCSALGMVRSALRCCL